MSQLELPKLALGVPKVDMSGEPEARLEGTSLALQNQIYRTRQAPRSVVVGQRELP